MNEQIHRQIMTIKKGKKKKKELNAVVRLINTQCFGAQTFIRYIPQNHKKKSFK